MNLTKNTIEYILPMAIERGMVGDLTDIQMRLGKIFLTFAKKYKETKNAEPIFSENNFEVSFS